MLLTTWKANNFRTGLRRALYSETVANMDVGGRAYRDVLVASLRIQSPPQAPCRQILSRASIPLGALLQFSYAALMRELSDEKLMQQYAKGDAKAFDQLYARHRAPLYRYFNRQINDAATVNDLYQGAWEKIIKARSKYRSNAPFKAWMYRIAHNHLVDYYRSLQPTGSVEADALPDDRPDPSQGLIEGEQTELLRAGITALPAEQRNTLLLKLETGLKMEEIASVTGVSRETVKSRLRYAVNKLKRSLVE